MLRGNRCILVALVGWLSLAAANPKDAAADPKNNTNHEVASALNNLAAAIQKQTEPGEHDEPCDAGDNKRTSDLCAQWKAADAANSAASAAWWIGIVGSVIGALTLAAAFAAARWAKKAAVETERGANAATDTYKAFVSVERPRLKPAAQQALASGLTTVEVLISAENIGKSSGYVHGIAYGSHTENTWPPPLTKFERMAKGCAVKGETASEIGTIVVSIDGKSGFVVGCLVYSSAFGEAHQSYFCIHLRQVREPHGEPAWWEAESFHKKGKWPEDT